MRVILSGFTCYYSKNHTSTCHESNSFLFTKPESAVEAGSYILLITTYDADFEFTAGSCLLNVTTYYSFARDSYGYVDVAVRLIMHTIRACSYSYSY